MVPTIMAAAIPMRIELEEVFIDTLKIRAFRDPVNRPKVQMLPKA
jgi:hypothetical protein